MNFSLESEEDDIYPPQTDYGNLTGPGTARRKLPDDMIKVPMDAYPSIVAYSIIFVVAAIGNVFVLVSTWKGLRVRSKPMNRLLLHLSIADLEVVFMVAAVEVVWRISIGWYVGDFACKVVQFLRAFGLYLSSLVLICISLDRYYAIVFPLRMMSASKRVKWMLAIAWISAAVCAVPQTIIFRVERHPTFPDFKQCMGDWLGFKAEFANTALSLSIMYFLPLVVIVFSYGNILHKISKESHGNTDDRETQFLRRNDSSLIGRAKIRTLKLTIVIVLVFLICWTPYVVISMCPIVYGLFHRKGKSRPGVLSVSKVCTTGTTAADI